MKFLGDFFGQIKPTFDDNSIDRLNYWWTTLITVFLSLMIGSFQFGGSPITCWSPKEFSKFWDRYLTDYCFVENTYFLSFNHSQIPDPVHVRKDAEIQYYQWVPFILAFQALLFYLPHVIWTSINNQSGISVQKIVSMARDTKNINYEKRNENVKTIAIHVEQSIDLQRDFGGKGHPLGFLMRCGKQQGFYVTTCYIFTKLLFVLNVCGQFALMNWVINPKYELWGPGIMRDIAAGREWSTSSHFPRVTFCDFAVRRLGAIHRYTVQCVIWINMLNEKIYLFLWFWMLLVAVLTILDLFYWLTVSMIPGFNRTFVTRFLKFKGLYDDELHRPFMNEFLKRLRPDGLFVLRLMSTNSGELITTGIVGTMWKRYIERKMASLQPLSYNEEAENEDQSKSQQKELDEKDPQQRTTLQNQGSRPFPVSSDIYGERDTMQMADKQFQRRQLQLLQYQNEQQMALLQQLRGFEEQQEHAMHFDVGHETTRADLTAEPITNATGYNAPASGDATAPTGATVGQPGAHSSPAGFLHTAPMSTDVLIHTDSDRDDTN